MAISKVHGYESYYQNLNQCFENLELHYTDCDIFLYSKQRHNQ